LLFGQAAGLKETSTKSGNRMAFFTLEDMDGAVDVTVFPEPYKAAAPVLRSHEALLVRGRVDDGEKGRVILADDVRLLEQALADGNGRPRNGAAADEPNACRIRVGAGGETLAELKRVCGEHPGRVPLFLHLVVDAQEVVVRARGLAVDGSPEFVAKAETLLGQGTVTVEYAGRA
jgi:DNA polymerase-3 subunit alpha